MMKSWIEQNLISNGKLISKKCKKEWFIKNNCIELYNTILKDTDFLNINATFPQRIWHIVNNIKNTICCQNPGCKNTTNFSTFTTGYLKTCSYKCAQLNPDTIKKIKETNLEKYGTEYGLSNSEVIDKRINTLIKNFGVDNPTKSESIKSQIQKTNYSKYKVNWILQDQVKKESAVYKKYGVKNIQHDKNTLDKRRNTQREIFYNSLFNSDRLKDKVIPLFNKEEYITNGYYKEYSFKCKSCNTIFLDCLEDGDVPRCTTCYKNSSVFEEDIYRFVSTLYDPTKIIRKSKKVIPPLELDIYVPDLKLAIECNGLFWHGESNGNKDKKYHLTKTLECERLGIRLIHIFEDEWIFKSDIVKSRLAGLFNKIITKIYARKCEIKQVSSKESNEFLNINHLQGIDKSLVQYGLYYNNELISIMTFGKLRIALGCNHTNNRQWELYRFCSKLNTIVIGGAHKLLKHFIKQHNPEKIISYADRRWSIGNLYDTIGFKLISNGTPNYWYFGKGNSYKRHHRFGFSKHLLSTKLKIFNNNISEWENMKLNGYDRIWDCGNLKYELIL